MLVSREGFTLFPHAKGSPESARDDSVDFLGRK